MVISVNSPSNISSRSMVTDHVPSAFTVASLVTPATVTVTLVPAVMVSPSPSVKLPLMVTSSPTAGLGFVMVMPSAVRLGGVLRV